MEAIEGKKSILKFTDGKEAAATSLIRSDAEESSIDESIAGSRREENVVINIGEDGVTQHIQIPILHTNPCPNRHCFFLSPLCFWLLQIFVFY